MKKIVLICISIILFLFISINIMVGIDKNDINNLKNDILDNSLIKDIVYVSNYDNYYIVIDNKYVYLLDSKYEEVLKIEESKIYDNKNSYQLVYRDNTIMYMDDYIDQDFLVFKYYDIYTYKLIDEVVVGGK